MMTATVFQQKRVARRARRGQALIMVVLLMFGLIALGGVFIAVISQAMTQVSRAADREALQSVLEAGLAYAQNELLYSPDGADWQPPTGPDLNNEGWVRSGDGFYKISVTYGPTNRLGDADIFLADNPLQRLLHLSVEARLALPNPTRLNATHPEFEAYRDGATRGVRFVRTAQAYMPIGLTDYLRWITNIDGTPEPVTLGSTLELADPTNPANGIDSISVDPDTGVTTPDEYDSNKITVAKKPYLAVFNGPIRSEVDTRLVNARIDLNSAEDGVGGYLSDPDEQYDLAYKVRRYDKVEIAGSLVDSSAYIMVNYHKEPMPISSGAVANRKINTSDPAQIKDSSKVITTLATDPLMRPLRAPRLDARHPATGLDRYRALTLGTATGVAPTPLDTATPTAIYALQGNGVYIHNPGHIQRNGDIARLRKEWLSPGDPGGGWTGIGNRVYDPALNGVVIIEFGDWQFSPSFAEPQITLRAYDSNGVLLNGPTGTQVDYPMNGVVFAEGNVVVKGNLPASIHYDTNGNEQGVGGDTGTSIQYYSPATPTNRRFDLTVVSGGTIYIEGSVLSPASRGVQFGGNAIRSGSAYDSKLALMAMDNVCLNPTKLYTINNGADPTATGSGSALYWQDPDGNSRITVSFATAGSWIGKKPWILVRHRGYSPNPGFGETVTARMYVNDPSLSNPYPWNSPSAFDLNFGESAVAPYGGAVLDSQPSISSPTGNVWAPLTNSLYSLLTNTVTLQRSGGTVGRAYMLDSGNTGTNTNLGPGFLVTRLDLQVDALMYAQRGSWFVIPGRYYNEDSTDPTMWNFDGSGSTFTNKWPFPRYKEPQDVRIVINGAIVENRPAPADEVREWEARWRGSNLDYFDSDADSAPDRWDPGSAAWDNTSWRWTNRRMGIEYHYDATLMRPVRYTVTPDGYRYLPRLPKLPVSPNLTNFSRTL